ncbi:MAG: glycerophosphodiester phosphodiesterase family protein [Anaerolineae bacterium]|jgi:glycerophosphoryl diester phosphodiesterase
MALSFLNSRQTLNIAHRGASLAAPPNTLTAFEKAGELGADGIEFDVRLSGDGVPVVIHDATVDATTDGSGRVNRLTLAQLKELDAGSSFDPTFAGERIPTLMEVLEAVGEQLLLNIELKSAAPLYGQLEPAVVDVIERWDLDERVLISSFNPVALRRIQRIAPHLATGVIYSPATRPSLLLNKLIAPRPHAAVHPYHAMVDEHTMRRARRRRYHVHVWTVDDVVEMRRLVELGVDGIITNVPEVLHGILPEGSE